MSDWSKTFIWRTIKVLLLHRIGILTLCIDNLPHSFYALVNFCPITFRTTSPTYTNHFYFACLLCSTYPNLCHIISTNHLCTLYTVEFIWWNNWTKSRGIDFKMKRHPYRLLSNKFICWSFNQTWNVHVHALAYNILIWSDREWKGAEFGALYGITKRVVFNCEWYMCVNTRPRCKIAPREFTAHQTFVLLFNRMPQFARDTCTHTHTHRHIGKDNK